MSYVLLQRTRRLGGDLFLIPAKCTTLRKLLHLSEPQGLYKQIKDIFPAERQGIDLCFPEVLSKFKVL